MVVLCRSFKAGFESHFGLLRTVVILSWKLILIGCCAVVAKRNFESHFGLLRTVVILSSNLVVVPTAAILLFLDQAFLILGTVFIVSTVRYCLNLYPTFFT